MKLFILSIILVFLLISCEKGNLIIPDIGRKIVINSLITTDSVLNVRISKSAFITDKSHSSSESLRSINNANVLVFQNDICIDSLSYSELWSNYYDYMYKFSNYFSKSVFPLPGKEYKIVAKVNGLPDATATAKIPDIVRIERVDTSRIILTGDTLGTGKVRLQFNIEFTDPNKEQNYYLLNICKKYTYYDLSHSDIIAFDSRDPIIEEKLIGPVFPLEGIAFSDRLINGKRYSLTVTLDGNTIGRPFYDDTPEDGGDHKKIIVLRLCSITKEYFRYIQSLNLYKTNFDNPLTEPVQVASNITGGYGIFSGAAISSDSIVFRY